MSRLIRLALVGRPNVGKSALFNAICKKKIAIVDEAEGVTRDRLYKRTELFGFPFELIDTGGIDMRSKLPFQEEVVRQSQIAIDEADSIILVVDGTTEPQELDLEIANYLHRSKKPVCLAVNKIDNRNLQDRLYAYSLLGIDQMIAVSATHGFQIAELVDAALKAVEKPTEETALSTSPHIAIIGRPNVGKSTLLNCLVGEERCIVSPIAGTTRDSIDTEVECMGKHYTFIDTAGIRKKQKEKDVIEKYAHIRTTGTIERADVCLLVVDALQGVTSEEKKIAREIEDAKKSCILLINKWDQAKGFRMEHCLAGLEQEIVFMENCPKLCISALTGRNVDKIFGEIDRIIERQNSRISTGPLNKCLVSAMQKYHPPVIGGKRLRVYYMTQVSTNPPHFVLFVNSPKLLETSYKRYLINCLRDTFGFQGVPFLLTLRPKAPQKKRAQSVPTHSSYDRDIPLIHDEGDDEQDDDLDLEFS